jgi:hypothetical protein
MTRIRLYTIAANGKSFVCHLCGWTHFSPGDVAELYCDKCRVFLPDVEQAADRARKSGVVRDDTSDRLAFLRRLVGKLRGLGIPTHLR